MRVILGYLVTKPLCSWFHKPQPLGSTAYLALCRCTRISLPPEPLRTTYNSLHAALHERFNTVPKP